MTGVDSNALITGMGIGMLIGEESPIMFLLGIGLMLIGFTYYLQSSKKKERKE